MNSNSKSISTTNDVPCQFLSTCGGNSDAVDNDQSAKALETIPHEQHQDEEEWTVPCNQTHQWRAHSWISGKSHDQSRIPFKKRHLFHPTPDANIACPETSSSSEKPQKKPFLDYLSLSRNASPSPQMLLSASLLETPTPNARSPLMCSLSANDEALSSTFSDPFFETPRLTQATPAPVAYSLRSHQTSRYSGTPFQEAFPTPLSALQTSLQVEKHHKILYSSHQDRDPLSPLLPRRLVKSHSHGVHHQEAGYQSVGTYHSPSDAVARASDSPLKEYDLPVSDDRLEIPPSPNPTPLAFCDTNITPTTSESAKIIIATTSKDVEENAQAILQYKFEPPPTMEDTYKNLFVDVRTTEHGCACRQSQCLKLYCDCFRSGVLCSAVFCCCNECRNSPAHNSPSGQRQIAIKKIIARQPKAFGFKAKERSRNTGCSCKKNRCLLKYCVCVGQGKRCSPEICSCFGCRNISPNGFL